MTKVDLITGFLGVGKTTFIKKYANYLISKGEKVHIIENEFGGLSIDARILTNEHLDVSQITGGCMCCTGRASFQCLLMEAAQAGFDRILVEPSGIYDVNQFFNIVQTPPVNTVCEVGNIITIIDAQSDEILSPEARSLMFSQLIYTGCVVASKSQMKEPVEIQNALNELQEILRKHEISRTLSCVTKPWDELTDDDFAAISSCGYCSMEHSYETMDHASVFFTTMIAGKFDTMEHLKENLHDILNTEKYGKVYRIKGYISDLDKNWYELNCSPSIYSIKKADIKRGLFLVIGQDYDEKKIKDLFVIKK